MSRYLPTLRGWVVILLALFAGCFYPAILPPIYVESGVQTWVSEPVSPMVEALGFVIVVVCFAASIEAFRRGSRPDKAVACVAILLAIVLLAEVLRFLILPVFLKPKTLLEPFSISLGGVAGFGWLRRGAGVGPCKQMAPEAHRILRVSAIAVVCYFVVFTAICWLLDFIGSDHLASQTRAWVAFDAGNTSAGLAFLCSLVLWRSHRKYAVAGFTACVLWVVWICLPRF
jgi:hypothetical protein